VEGNVRRSQGSRWTLAPWVTRKNRTCTNAPIDHSAKQMGTGPTVRVKYRQTEVTKKLVVICTNTRHQKTSKWLMIRRALQVRRSASTHVMVSIVPLFVIIPTRFCSFTPSSGGGTQTWNSKRLKLLNTDSCSLKHILR
jgi:hypothetical protein